MSGVQRVVIAVTVIVLLEYLAKWLKAWKDPWDARTFEISMCILMAAWILREGW